jgi:hypothetical protein
VEEHIVRTVRIVEAEKRSRTIRGRPEESWIAIDVRIARVDRFVRETDVIRPAIKPEDTGDDRTDNNEQEDQRYKVTVHQHTHTSRWS